MVSIKHNNRGFSLVELLVALAIGGILVAGIGSILIVSSKSFASTSAEAGMQSAAQIVMDHIQDVVIDANQKIGYSYSTADPVTPDSWVDVEKEGDIPGGVTVTSKKLSVYNFDVNDVNRNRRYDFTWIYDPASTDGEKSHIDYAEYSINVDLSEITQIGDTETLAENVTSFRCDLSDIETKRILYVEMDFKKGTKEYHAANNISLRNKVGTSVSAGSLSSNITVKTLDLSAEPGMKYPVGAGAKATATGNVSNRLVFEVDTASEGTPGSKETKAGSRIIPNTSTLEISRTEQLDKIVVAAIDELGGRHTFDVYVNRVFWTQSMTGGRGDDTTDGIIINGNADMLTDDVNIGDSKAFSITLAGNEGYGHQDRTKASPSVSADMTITGDNANKYTLTTTEGSHTFTLSIKPTAKKNTKVKIRFTARHSLANGGLPGRTVAYPADDGVYKDLVITVTNPGPAGIDGVLLRGQLRDGSNEINPEDMLNDPGQEELRRLFTDGTGVRWMLWRPYRLRPATDDSGFNLNYEDTNDGWGDPMYTDEPSGTVLSQFVGWHKLSGGYRITLNGSEFNCLSPKYDTQIQFFFVKTPNNNANSTVLGQTSVVTTTMYGLRTLMSRNDTDATADGIYAGTVYSLDKSKFNRFYENQNYYKVWQKENSLQSLRHINGTGGGGSNVISMRLVYSQSHGSGASTLLDSLTVNDADVDYTLGGKYYKAAYTVFPGGFGNSIKDRFSISDRPYYIWPEITYTSGSHPNTYDPGSSSRTYSYPSSFLEFYYKEGNIDLRTPDGTVKAFVPYPGVEKRGRFYSEHPDFYGVGAGTKTIETKNGSKTYDYSLSEKDDGYYIKLYTSGEYKFDTEKEEWVYKGEAEDTRRENLTTTDKVKWYVPGPDDEDFYTGYKSLADDERYFITRMPISKKANGKWVNFANTNKNNYGTYRFYIQKTGENYFVYVDMPKTGTIDKYQYNKNNKKWEYKSSEPDIPLLANLTTYADDFYDEQNWYIPGPDEDGFYYGFDLATDRPEFADDMEIIDVDDYLEYENEYENGRFRFFCYKNGNSYELHLLYPDQNVNAENGYEIRVYRYANKKWSFNRRYQSSGTGANLKDTYNGQKNFYIPGPDAINFYEGFYLADEEPEKCPVDEMEIYEKSGWYTGRYHAYDGNYVLYYANKDDKYYIIRKGRKWGPDRWEVKEYEWNGTEWNNVKTYDENI